MARKKTPGTIYLNGQRWWWLVQLPGEPKRKARPLRPAGAKYATKDRAVAEQVAADLYRRAIREAESPATRTNPSVADIVAAYMAGARTYYRRADGTPTQEVGSIELALAHLLADVPDPERPRQVRNYSTTPAEDFGPRDLKAVRQAMIGQGLARTTCNARTNRIRRCFRWAVGEELVPPSVAHGLQAVPGLRRGRTDARETEPVKPVAERHARLTARYASHTVAAMIELQLLTGARPGEVCQMRPMDLDTTGPIWLCRPAQHKTAHHGHTREIALGPRAQALVQTRLNRPTDKPLFTPAEAIAERRAERRAARRTPDSQGNAPGRNRKADPKRAPGDRYTTAAYGKAIRYAIDRANRAIEAELRRETPDATDEQIAEALATRGVPHWHPHQLRHTAATRLRREHGLDVARAVLGQRSLGMADAYAELDHAAARQAAQQSG